MLKNIYKDCKYISVQSTSKPGHFYKYIKDRWKNLALKLIKDYKLKDNSKIIDFGCGKGFLLYEIQKINPKIHMHKRPCWECVFLEFGALRPSKNSFSLERGATNHMFTKFSLFFRITPKSYKKLLKIGLEIFPKHSQIYNQKMIQIFIEFLKY